MKPCLDKLTALVIAYTILVYKSTKEVWEEILQIKASSKDDKERRHTTRHKNSSIMKEGESISKGIAPAGLTMGKSFTRNCSRSVQTSSQVMYGRHYKIIGNCIRQNIMTKLIIKMRTQRPRKKNVRRAIQKTGR
jgi:hypothetical protein